MVTVARTGGEVVAEIVDDGIGGAALDDGSELRGVADRLEALRGRLELDSPPGAGTRLRAVVPVNEPSRLRRAARGRRILLRRHHSV